MCQKNDDLSKTNPNTCNWQHVGNLTFFVTQIVLCWRSSCSTIFILQFVFYLFVFLSFFCLFVCIHNNAVYRYLPPEITRFRHGWELKLGDAWSIGVIAYVLLTGKPPFLGKSVKETIHIIGTKPLRWPNPKKIPLSTNCKTFIKRLLTKVPRSRSTIAQALEHPWIVDNKNNPNVGAANLLSGELLTNIADFNNAGMYVLYVCHILYLYL